MIRNMLELIFVQLKLFWTMITSTLDVYLAIDSVKTEILSVIFGVSTTLITIVSLTLFFIKIIKNGLRK